MQRLGPFINTRDVVTLTAQDAIDILEQSKPVATYFESMDRAGRSKIRTRMLGASYSPEFVAALLPVRNSGPKAIAAVSGTSPWLLLPGPSRLAVADAVGLDTLPVDRAYWDETKANKAATAISNKYENSTTATLNLTKLRSALTLIYEPASLPDAIRTATLRPDRTAEHNLANAARLAERVATGFEAPAPFQRIADIRERVLAFIAGSAPASAQTLADLLVVFAARPGEAERLKVGQRGGVSGITDGILKKRDKAGKSFYPIASAVGADTAVQLLNAWKGVRPGLRTQAANELPALCRGWGIQPRDLRAVGASLAVRAAVLEGDASNVGQQRETLRTALRHEPARAQAREHYERVRDPVAILCAQLAELSPADRARIATEVARMSAA